MQQSVFEPGVFKQLQLYYFTPSAILGPNRALSPLEESKVQRTSLKLLRYLGTSDIKLLLDFKERLFKHSLALAQQEKPDFMLVKEALMCYERLMLH